MSKKIVVAGVSVTVWRSTFNINFGQNIFAVSLHRSVSLVTKTFAVTSRLRHVARFFVGWGGGGEGEGEGRVWAVQLQTRRGSGGMLPRENFKNFGLVWTTFRAFSW